MNTFELATMVEDIALTIFNKKQLRQYYELTLIPFDSFKSTSEISKSLKADHGAKVSIRTIERDLEALRGASFSGFTLQTKLVARTSYWRLKEKGAWKR